ncbi:MAG: hypothetical protein J5850_04475, partial [Clostridia bacterium]|nr:hypothetical protein [Clostridia bacterium]
MPDLFKLKKLIFESDNNACFIERERILGRLSSEMSSYNKPDKYALILSRLLEEVSVPINESDYFAGRAIELLPDPEMAAPNWILGSTGHMSFNYSDLLRYGLKGILEKIKNAETNYEDSREFRRNAEIVVNAVKKFAARYSDEARNKGFDRMADALSRVPFEPAYDFYSALQSIWLIHFIASCYVGSRDYAFGRFDEYMYPYYEDAIKNGATKEEITELLAGFLIKTNEICGRGTHNYKCKPVPCQAAKQYLNIGGENPNEFSFVVLDAAVLSEMAQPQITVILDTSSDSGFVRKTFEAMSILSDKLHVYNYRMIKDYLLKKGIPERVAKDFTFSACCTFDLNYHSYRLEYFTPVPQIFETVIKNNEFNNIEELKKSFSEALTKNIQTGIDNFEELFQNKEFARKHFVFDGLLLTDSAYNCRYPCDGKSEYTVFNIFFPGVATIGDSLMVLDKLVFKEKRFSYGTFIDILNKNYEGYEDIRQEIKEITKFGNDTESDSYTSEAGNLFIDSLENVNLKKGRYAIGGFYSLERENTWKEQIGATPDGRKAGDPFSENQSPSYGSDKSGITALLKSVAKLPFYRTATGGLNLTFSQKITPEVLKSLILAYFELGGLHVGITVADKDTLTDA